MGRWPHTLVQWVIQQLFTGSTVPKYTEYDHFAPSYLLPPCLCCLYFSPGPRGLPVSSLVHPVHPLSCSQREPFKKGDWIEPQPDLHECITQSLKVNRGCLWGRSEVQLRLIPCEFCTVSLYFFHNLKSISNVRFGSCTSGALNLVLESQAVKMLGTSLVHYGFEEQRPWSPNGSYWRKEPLGRGSW